MHARLFALLSAVVLANPALAAPVVTLGPPLTGPFMTIDPGSIQVDNLVAGDVVDLQISVTVHAVCFRPILFGLTASGDGGTFTNLTGTVLNGCGGDTSEFAIQLSGDGLGHAFDIDVVDVEFDTLMASIPVALSPAMSDVDNDGIADDSDNCILLANADQRDTDADDIGNVCDPDVALPNDCIVNVTDLGIYKKNFFQAGDLDTDNNGDGLTNAIDLGVLRSFFFGPPGPSGRPNACAPLGAGDVCDPTASQCGEGLSCCYPCGVPGCDTICVVDCDPADPLCFDGCLVLP